MPYLFQPPIFAAQAATAVFIPQPQQPRVIYTASPATLFRPATLLGGVPLIAPPLATTFINIQRPPPPPQQQQFVLSAPMYAVFAPPAPPPPRWFP